MVRLSRVFYPSPWSNVTKNSRLATLRDLGNGILQSTFQQQTKVARKSFQHPFVTHWHTHTHTHRTHIELLDPFSHSLTHTHTHTHTQVHLSIRLLSVEVRLQGERLLHQSCLEFLLRFLFFFPAKLCRWKTAKRPTPYLFSIPWKDEEGMRTRHRNKHIWLQSSFLGEKKAMVNVILVLPNLHICDNAVSLSLLPGRHGVCESSCSHELLIKWLHHLRAFCGKMQRRTQVR